MILRRSLLFLVAVAGCAVHRPPAVVSQPTALGLVVLKGMRAGRIAGIVVDTAMNPVEHAFIVLDGRRRVESDARGEFRIDSVSPGTHSIHTLRIGMWPRQDAITISDDEGAAVVLRLRADTRPLQEICTTQMEPGILVRVTTANGTAPPAGTTITVRDGSFVETAPRPREELSAFNGRALPFAYERPGTYALDVSAPGFAPWHRTHVVVPHGKCHVTRQSFEVVLQR